MESGFWVRVRLGDAPPAIRVPDQGEPRWVRASGEKPTARDDEPEARTTWLVDSFEIVAPRYPWKRD
ncbi:hypothetical protein [Saccharothrix variisporea]|uniref:Uncharacterized protein n=1 Tax=Saccharothrix variisporea TaxID=543527 RepID=A0A495XAJ4_9PSEU|nr:hypothetical protein [Saccharothrix variisporea]RKT71290.1 hypothetical protein DFJ66_4573 [Saccharothrix variisporea]